MRLIAASVATILAALNAAQAQELAPPIAQATSGQLQCYQPNIANKSCRSLAGYRMTVDGIVNTAVAMLSADPLITMETVTHVEIKNGQVCGKMRAHDIQTAKLLMNGSPVSAQIAETLQKQLFAGLKSEFDHEICTAYIPDGDGFIAKATDNGVPVPGKPRVIWVSPGDGYKVAPQS
jgi:translation initiation factor IF-1